MVSIYKSQHLSIFEKKKKETYDIQCVRVKWKPMQSVENIVSETKVFTVSGNNHQNYQCAVRQYIRDLYDFLIFIFLIA